MGRPGGGRLHRRPHGRRGARSQRPAPGPLGPGHRGLCGAGLRDRGDHGRARARAAQGPPGPRQAVPARPRGGPDRRGRGGQAPRRPPQALRRVVRALGGGDRRPARAPAARAPGRAAALQAAGLRLLAGGPAADHRADGLHGRGAGGQHGQRRRPGGDVRPPAAAVLLLQAAVRAGDQPAGRPAARERRDEPADRGRRRGQPPRRDARAGPPARHDPADPAQRAAREAAPGLARDLRRRHAGHHVADRGRPRRDGAAAGRAVPGGLQPGRPPGQHPHPLGPQPRARAGGDAVAVGRRRGPPPPRPRRHPAAHGPGDRVRRAPRHPPHGDAHRLRRRRHQPVPDVRVPGRARRPLAAARGPRARGGRAADRQGDRQGPAQDHLQDGHLHHPVLLRRADLRGRGARARADRQVLHRHRQPDRRSGPRGPRRRGPRPPLPRLPAHRARGAARRRRPAVAARRRAPHLESGHDRQPPARGARQDGATATVTAAATAGRAGSASPATRRRPTTCSPSRPTTSPRAPRRCAA